VVKVFGIEVVVEKKGLTLLHARLRGKMWVCRITELRYEMDRDVTMIKWDDGTHRGAVGTSGLLQDIHTSDRVRGLPVTTRHGELRYDIETVDECKVEGMLWSHFPNRVKDESYLSYEKTCLWW
jgi:hypothetical protein